MNKFFYFILFFLILLYVFSFTYVYAGGDKRMVSEIYNEVVNIAEHNNWKMARLEQINNETIGIMVYPFKNKDSVIVYSDKVGSFLDIFPIISNDGKRIAFWKNENFEKNLLFLVNIDGSNLQKLIDIPIGYNISWSPDNRKIAFVGSFKNNLEAGKSLFVIDIDLKRVDTLIKDNVDYITIQAWSPNNTELLYVTAGNIIMSYNFDNKLSRKIAKGNCPVWSPNGDWIAYLENGNLNLISNDGKNKKNLDTSTEGNIMSPISWLPNGEFILYGKCLESHCEIGTPFIMKISDRKKEQILDNSWMLSSWGKATTFERNTNR